MKNALKNFLLWQKKRNELPIQDDPQVDWGQMRSLLDEQMPVIKKTGGFKGFRTLPALFITFSAAAMIYVAGNIYSLEHHNHTAKHRFHKGSTIQAGSQVSGLDSSSRKKDTAASSPDGQPGLKNDSIQSAASDNDSLSSKTDQVTNAKSNGVAINANKTSNGSTGLKGRSGALTIQQNYDPAKSSAADRKSRFYSSGSSHHNNVTGAADWGHTNQNQKAGENKTGGNNAPVGNQSQIARGGLNAPDSDGTDGKLFAASQSALKFNFNLTKIQPVALPVLNSRLSQALLQAGKQTKGGKKDKPVRGQNSKVSNVDWGILMGINTSGSFTPKNQNANFYGSAPLDPWFGFFASYKINANWAIATEVHFFSPQNIVTTYTHANQSKVDSNQSLTITASRKMYTVSIPIYAVYNAGNGFSLKAGPVINFPVKQINTNSVLSPYNIRSDTTYFKNISTILNATKYQQNINFGFSAGASYKFKRFIFEATYLKSLSGYGISSGLGAYKSYSGTFQLTIGFQLDKVKP